MILHVNVDHVATLREARGTKYPDPVEAALLAIKGGADGITVHLREDRRHIKDGDLRKLRDRISVTLNMEMAATDEMVSIACEIKPEISTIVPERRQERTTERGLNVTDGRGVDLEEKIRKLKSHGIKVSLFVEPVEEVIKEAASVGADIVELHTGKYSLLDGAERDAELEVIRKAARVAKVHGLFVAAGHGLDYSNVKPVSEIEEVEELSIGHSIVSRAVFVGMEKAVRQMKEIIGR